MDLVEAINPLTRVGLCVQLAAVASLALLFAVLGRQAPGRKYFSCWSWAWAALAAAYLALALRFGAIPVLPAAALSFERQPAVRFLYYVYQAGKVLGVGLIAAGAFTVRFPEWRLRLGPALAALGALSVGSVAMSGRLEMHLVLQSLLVVPVFGAGAWALLGRSERLVGVGPRLTGLILAALAVLWLAYGFDYAQMLGVISVRELPTFLRGLVTLNTFIDSVGTLLLGYGMVLILMEDVRAETIEERAARLRDVAASEARLAGIVRSARDAIITLDETGTVSLANPAAEAMFARGAKELVGLHVSALISDVGPVMLHTAAGAAPFGSGHVVPRFQLSGRRADGGQFPLELSAAALDEPGIRGWILVIGDITQRRQHEAEREALQERLAHAQKMEAVGRLVSGVAHELNNPLAAILTFSESLLHGQHPPEDREALEAIRDQAQRSRTIVRDLLAFVGRREERRERLAPAALLERVVRGVTPLLARHGAVLQTDIPRDLPELQADTAGIEQVVTNLLSNAAYAAGEGGRVVLSARSGAFGALAITVTDSGPGIPPEAYPRLFEPFFTTKPPGVGTGLGLSVSLGIVENHGGGIKAENLPGGGARFTVTLPRVERASPASVLVPQRPAVTHGAGLPAVEGHARVLLIEDEQPVRLALRRYFERQGWQVDEASDGAQGLARLQADGVESEYRLVVCDLKMPGVSGIELHERLAAARAPVLDRLIFATGDVASPEAAAFLARTTRPVLEKPFELAQLAQAVRAVLAADG
jgi:two-component system NtrC family sensor kinase